MAQGMYIKIVGDASSYEQALRKAAGDTKKFNREVSQATRGAVAGSGLFRSFGRSIAFASGGFVGFAGVTHFLRESVDAARDAAVSQRSLAAQMKASGESFTRNQERIEEVAKSYAKFGFQNDEVIKSLTVLDRGTGDINKALELQGLVADLARAKNIDLASAAQTVAKVFGGQETALRRAVPGLHKTAHGMDLIREAQRKLAGQAAANTTASERFAATLHDTQEILGTGLLPILNKYLDQLSKWMDQMQRSGELAKDVKTFANAIDALTSAIGPLVSVTRKYYDIRDKIRSKFGHFGFLLPDPENQINNLKNIVKWTERGVSWGKQLLGIHDSVKAKVMYPPGTLVGPPAPTGGAPGPTDPQYTRRQRNQFFDAAIGRALSRAQYKTLVEQVSIYKQIAEKLRERIKLTQDITRQKKLEDQLLSVLASEREARQQLVDQAFEIAIGRAGLTETLSDDIRELEKQNRYLKRQIQLHKNNRDLILRQIDVQGQINDLRKQQAEQAKQDRQEAAQRRQEAARRRQEALSTRLFGILGFGPGGAARIPNIHQLRAQFAELMKHWKELPPRIRREAIKIRKVLQESLLPPDIRQKTREMMNAYFDELRKGAGGTPRGFTYNHPGVGGRSLAFAAAGVHVGTVNVYNTHNVGDLENQLTKRQAGRAHNRRGAR